MQAFVYKFGGTYSKSGVREALNYAFDFDGHKTIF